jgi:very-short-patch-repair endonuclease
VLAARQLADLGLSQQTISDRVAAGRLHRVHRGVYAVGHRILSANGRRMAAVLACGPGAALSHAAAAALWELRPSDATIIDVSVPGRAGRMKRPGLRIHRPRTLRPDELTTRHGIPVTTPARTILDLAGSIAGSRIERLLDQAEILELTDYPSLDALARAHPGHKGAGKLTRALQAHTAGTTLTRSELEERFFKLCRVHALPRPEVNERVAGKEVDFLFAEQRLIVETDSWRFHRTRQAFERDRTRDATLLTLGYRTLRVTHRALESDPKSVGVTLKTVLGT